MNNLMNGRRVYLDRLANNAAGLHERSSSNSANASIFAAASKKAARVAESRKMLRKLVDRESARSRADLDALGRAMIDVGAALCGYRGNAEAAARYLNHLSRRVRDGEYYDF